MPRFIYVAMYVHNWFLFIIEESLYEWMLHNWYICLPVGELFGLLLVLDDYEHQLLQIDFM